jgi:hypothetical protein
MRSTAETAMNVTRGNPFENTEGMLHEHPFCVAFFIEVTATSFLVIAFFTSGIFVAGLVVSAFFDGVAVATTLPVATVAHCS